MVNSARPSGLNVGLGICQLNICSSGLALISSANLNAAGAVLASPRMTTFPFWISTAVRRKAVGWQQTRNLVEQLYGVQLRIDCPLDLAPPLSCALNSGHGRRLILNTPPEIVGDETAANRCIRPVRVPRECKRRQASQSLSGSADADVCAHGEKKLQAEEALTASPAGWAVVPRRASRSIQGFFAGARSLRH